MAICTGCHPGLKSETRAAHVHLLGQMQAIRGQSSLDAQSSGRECYMKVRARCADDLAVWYFSTRGERGVDLTRRWGDGVGWRASWVARATALAVLVALATPGCAAGERAVKSKVAPVYPEIAKRLHVSGVVKLEITIDADGKVTEVKTVSGNQMLAAAAEDAVHKWRYVAGDGQATVDLSINFDLPK